MKPSTQSIQPRVQPLFQNLEEKSAAPADPVIPDYLQKVYWWAYLHPNAVRVFEREWLVNLILWGNFRSLRDTALAEFDAPMNQRMLQVACVYGDFSQRIASRLGPDGRLDIVDVAPIQLANLRRKLSPDERIHLHRQDSSALHFADASFDSTLIFFLLHEQPEAVRRATLAEALRATRPGGKIVIVDYHNPTHRNLLRYPMKLVLKTLEPFACDLWTNEIASYLPKSAAITALDKTCYFAGLYQKVVIKL
jgi:ubiquinone/menaquinone biosynthesis C-methylase UbiE